MDTIAPRRPTPADRVTLFRAALTACCAVPAVASLFTGGHPGPVLVLLGALAFLLDAVDGAVARRTGTASEAGARFDAATDAALVLVLSVATVTVVGPWTLAIGALYYVVAAAAIARPHLRRPLPPSITRKLIGALQPVALLIALLPGLPPAAAAAAPAVALPLLVFSFGRDVVALERQHRTAAGADRRGSSFSTRTFVVAPSISGSPANSRVRNEYARRPPETDHDGGT
ncbi:CDP-alcohol phosphatidyltransferase family protein [Arthrobacter sp. BHU FT2]|nr:CDP-alcohol phosphatidyltransferase family protein [Arthrobacter sp. BHU FT2]